MLCQAHEQAERATARAAVRAGSAFMLSSLASVSMEESTSETDASRPSCSGQDVAHAVPTERDGKPKGLIFQLLAVSSLLTPSLPRLYVFKRRDVTEACSTQSFMSSHRFAGNCEEG